MYSAVGLDPYRRRWDLRLGDPSLLIGRRRQRIIEMRDQHLVE